MSLSIGGSSIRKSGEEAKQAAPKNDFITAEHAMSLLEEKVASRYKSVREAFIRFDSDCDGMIGANELRFQLEAMGLKLNGREFRRIWRMFDVSGEDDAIPYTKFNNKFGIFIKPMSLGLQMNRPETPAMKDWQRKSMAARIRNQIKDIEETFKKFDTDGSGMISHAEFITALRSMGVRGVGDADSWQMMQRFRKPGNHSGTMSYEEFRDCMMDYLKLGNKGAEGEAILQALDEAEAMLEVKLPRDTAAVRRAFARFDDEKLGDLSHSQLKTAFASLGVHLSKDQFAALMTKYDPSDDGSVGISEFAKLYAGAGVGGGSTSGIQGTARSSGAAGGGASLAAGALESNWAKLGIRPIADVSGARPDARKLARTCAPKLGLNEAETHLLQSLVGRGDEFKVALKRADKDGAGDLTKSQFKAVLEGMNIPMSQDTIASLVPRLDKTKSGRINYVDLMTSFGRYLVLNEPNLSSLGFEKIPLREQQALAQFAAASYSSASTACQPKSASSSGQQGPAPSNLAYSTNPPPSAAAFVQRSGGGGAAAGSSAAMGRSSHRPLAAAGRYIASPTKQNQQYGHEQESHVNMDDTAKKMAKVLGKNWESVAQDVIRKAQRETLKAATMDASSSLWAGAGAGAREAAAVQSGSISAEVFRDTLAQHGVPLTSKEVRALTLRYGHASAAERSAASSGVPNNARVNGTINMDRLAREMAHAGQR